MADFTRTSSLPLRLAWAVVMIGTLGLLVTFVTLTIQAYLSATLITSINVVKNNTMQLPQIAICYNDVVDVNKSEKVNIPLNIFQGLRRRFQLQQIDVQNDLSDYASGFSEILRDGYEGNLAVLVEKISYTCKQLIIRGFSYSVTNVTTCPARIVAHSIYGMCFVLPRITQMWPGTMAGWKLLLGFPKIAKKYQSSQVTSGYAVELGDNLWYSTFETFKIPKGKDVSLMLRPSYLERIQRIKWPRHSNPLCKGQSDGVDDGFADNACFFECWTQSLIKLYNCVEYGFEMFVSNVSICNPFTFTYDTALVRDGSRECQSRCLPSCNLWKYEPILSFSSLNRDIVMDELGLAEEYEDVTSLTVAYAALEYAEVIQKESSTFEMTVSNVGGQLGLWMGVSVITLFQAFCYFSYNLATNISWLIGFKKQNCSAGQDVFKLVAEHMCLISQMTYLLRRWVNFRKGVLRDARYLNTMLVSAMIVMIKS